MGSSQACSIYLQGRDELGLRYTRGNDIRLGGFTDADWAGSPVDRKSTSGYYFNVGSGMTSWLLESVIRIGLHIDYVIMYLCKEEDKDNKMYSCYTCFMGFMNKILL